MDIIRETTRLQEYHSAVFDMYFDGMSFAAFDIETTGLSPSSSQVMLTGFCSCEGDRCETVQFFADSLNEEAELLEKTLEYMQRFDFVITYNGHHFDTPFTLKRARGQRIDYSLIQGYPYDFDLYPLVKRFSDIRSFTPNLKQKTIENFMGLWNNRADEIDGGESVRMYYDYLVSRRSDLKEKILLHNHDDVLQLYRLLAVTGRTDMHAAMNRLGFPVRTRRGVFVIKEADIKGSNLTISGLQPADPISYQYPGDGYISFRFDVDGTFAGESHKVNDHFDPKGTFSVNIALEPHDGMMLADLTKFPVKESAFAHLPTYGSGYLILSSAHGTASASGSRRSSKNSNANCMEINLMAQQLIRGIVSRI